MATALEKEASARARAARAAAAEVQSAITQVAANTEVKMVLPGAGGDRVVGVPREALELFAEVLEALGDGKVPSVVPAARELSTGEVASLLGVSRQYAVRLLDDGKIPFRRVGNRRRVQLRDVLRYQRKDDRERIDRLRDLAEATLS